LRASSAVYFTITSALSSWKSRNDRSTMSPWLIQTYKKRIQYSAPTFTQISQQQL
jgi:hypothetical protein